MLYATNTTYDIDYRKLVTIMVHGHINDDKLKEFMNESYETINKIQADGDELERCCKILGRELPPNRVYTFLGYNAKEIAINWM